MGSIFPPLSHFFCPLFCSSPIRGPPSLISHCFVSILPLWLFYFLCDGLYHEPTPYNLITFPSQHQFYYNSETPFLFSPSPPYLRSQSASTTATNKELIILLLPHAPFVSCIIVVHPSVFPRLRLGLAFVWWLFHSLYVFPARVYRVTYSMDRFVFVLYVFLASVRASPYSRTDIHF